MTYKTPEERTESLVKSALQYGRRQQVELIALLNRSKSTVRTHLEKLVEQEEIEKTREAGKVFYSLPDQSEEPMEPKPLAKDGEIGVMLDTIADSMGLLNHQEYSKHNTRRSEYSSELFDDETSDRVSVIWEYRYVCDRKYEVLSNNKNLRKCMTILDEVIATFDKENQTNAVKSSPREIVELPPNQHPKRVGVLVLPDFMYARFFDSLLYLLRHWKRGQEHKELYSELGQRTEAIIRNAPRMPDDFGAGIQEVVVVIDPEGGEEMFRRMVEYGNYDMESLRESAYWTYERRNNIDGLFETLDKIEQRVSGEDERKIQSLKEKIRDDYR